VERRQAMPFFACRVVWFLLILFASVCLSPLYLSFVVLFSSFLCSLWCPVYLRSTVLYAVTRVPPASSQLLELKSCNFKALKVLENEVGPRKSVKSPGVWFVGVGKLWLDNGRLFTRKFRHVKVNSFNVVVSVKSVALLNSGSMYTGALLECTCIVCSCPRKVVAKYLKSSFKVPEF